MTGRRKLAAILSADVAGYSRLMAADEAGTLLNLNQARAVFTARVQAHHGRVVDTAGDSVLAEFDSPVEAVRCAVSVQQELDQRGKEMPDERRMRFRIGVNLGDVIEENAGLYGDGVNVAARLQALSEPGGLSISGTVFDQVDGKLPLAFKFMGEQAVKNIPKPVRVYHLLRGEPRPARRRTVHLALIAAVLFVTAAAAVWWQSRPAPEAPAASAAQPAARPRLAVLPLDNFSASAEDEYFSDGMTEELISKLSRVQGMDVIARTSVMRYKRTDKSIADIGRELNVNSVLEGSVRKAGDKVRITVQLIDVGTQAHLWSQDFDRELKDVIATQSEISEQVANALHVRLVEASTNSPPEVDLETYTLYLKGRYESSGFNAEGLKRSIALFQQALDRSPNDARVWAGMARSYAMLGWWQFVPPSESLVKAKGAAEKALQLNDRLAEAYVSLGMVRFLYEWDWPGAEQAYLRAIELNPGDADAHLFYGVWHKAMGNNAQAVEEIRRANELDPQNLMANAETGWVGYFGRRFDEGVRNCRRTLEKDPNYLFALSCLQMGLAMRKDEETIQVARKILDLASQDPYFLGQLAWAYGVMGRRQEAEQIIRQLQESSKATPLSPPTMLYAYLGLQEADPVMQWMERAYRERWSDVVWIKTGPEYDWLRPDPRFQALLKKMKLDG